jgi:hypothetical protein
VAPPTLEEAFAKVGLRDPRPRPWPSSWWRAAAGPHPRGSLLPCEPLQVAVDRSWPSPRESGHHPATDQGPPGHLAEVCDSAARVARYTAADSSGRGQASPS